MSAERSVVVRVRAEIGDFKKSMADAEKSTAALAAAASKSSTSLDQAGAASRAAGTGVAEVGAASDKAAGQLEKADKATLSHKDALMESAKAAKEAAGSLGYAYDANGKLVDGMGQIVPASTAAQLGLRSVVNTFDDMGNVIVPTQTKWQSFSSAVSDNQSKLTSAGTAMAAFGGAILGVGAAAMSTGIQYNTLQQTTRSALTTLMGSAQGANDQMDKLDTFAKTSPFAKQVFITAQQQLIGFGMSAEKVLPTLDAIQNAVAAVGGSSESIGEISNILAKVTSTGKITAVTLNQLGLRGVDAATIIGEQMGRTGLQIRDDITDGAVGAEEAMDALVAGMQEKFGGAAAGLKDTFVGASDRVKSAFRDISASMASPFVNQGGGGILVDGLNSLADGMRKFEKWPEPIKNTTFAIGGVAGAAALAGGSFLLLLPRAVSTIDAFKTLRGMAPVLSTRLGAVGKAAGAAAIGFIALQVLNSLAYKKAEVSIEQLTQSLIKMKTQIDGMSSLDEMFSDFGTFAGKDLAKDINGIGDAIERITNPKSGDGINRWADETFAWTGFAQSETTKVDQKLKLVGESMASFVAKGDTDTAAEAFKRLSAEFETNGSNAQDALDHLPAYRDSLLEIGNNAGLALEPMELLDLAAGKVPDRLQAIKDAHDATAKAAEEHAALEEEIADALDEVGLAADGTVLAVDRLMESMFKAGLAQMSVRDATGAYHQSLRDVEKQIEDYIKSGQDFTDSLTSNGKAFDVTTESGYKASQIFDGVAGKAITMTENMAKNGAGQQELQKQLQTSHADLVKVAERFGITGDAADDMARDVLGIPKDVKIETAIKDYAKSLAELITLGSEADALDGKTSNIWVTTNKKSIYSEEHVSNGRGGSGGQTAGGFTGGAIDTIMGMWTGGVIPGVTPTNKRHDNILALVNGRPLKVQSGEYLVNSEQTRKNLPLLEAINAGRDITGYMPPSKSLAAGYAPTMSVSGYGASGGFDYARLASLLPGGNSYSISVPQPAASAQDIFDVLRFEERRNSRGGTRK